MSTSLTPAPPTPPTLSSRDPAWEEFTIVPHLRCFFYVVTPEVDGKKAKLGGMDLRCQVRVKCAFAEQAVLGKFYWLTGNQ